jgi:hypothetical protein
MSKAILHDATLCFDGKPCDRALARRGSAISSPPQAS